MNEQWATLFGTNSIAIEAGEISVLPGLGRHQLRVQIKVRQMADVAHGHEYAFSGSLRGGNGLRGGVGRYLGHFHKTQPRRLVPHGLIEEQLLADMEVQQFDAIERIRDGEFSLDLSIEVEADLGSERTTVNIRDHPVSREAWIGILDQIHFQKTILLELPTPDPQASPSIAGAISFYLDAQNKFREGENRLTMEALRQSLVALNGSVLDDEETTEEVGTQLKSAKRTQPGYSERFELVGRALKFLSDLGAHPESGETGRQEARTGLIMVGGLLQWYGKASR